MYKINFCITHYLLQEIYNINLYYKIAILDFFNVFRFEYKIINNQIDYQPFQIIIMNDNIINNLSNFINKYYSNKYNHKIKNKLKIIKNGEPFILFIEIYITNSIYCISDILEISEEKLQEVYNIDKKYVKNYKEYISKYFNIITTIYYDDKGKYTFNYKIKPKVCKYCNNSDKKYFSNESHIIPENIGGHLIDSLECDKCNSWFNENIEQDFSKFLDVAKTLFCIKGKRGIPKILNNDFNIEYDNLNKKDILTFTVKNPEITLYNIQQYKFEIIKDINLYNIYKTLCKIALGVIDYKQIEIFSDTIKWLKDLNTNTKIPIVIFNNHFNIVDHLNKPYLYVYIRKNNDYNIPYTCAELNCRFMSFYYIIPFSKNDRNNFLNKDEVINLFKDIFYIKSNNYRILDCNENKKTDFKYIINLDLK